MSSFFGELRRRNVYKVAVAYAIVAWLLVEIASLVFDAFNFPEWTVQFFITLIALGFPVALIFAWAFELTPDGIKRTHDVPVEQSVTYSTGRKLDFVIIGLLSAAVVFFAYNYDWGGDDADEGEQVVAVTPPDPSPETDGPKSIAVLPFANLSDNEENEYFASGVHEDVLTYLSRVADLRVISRTSVLKYKDDQSDIPAIAAALGVDHVVEGSVRRSGNRVRVTAQLIDADTDHHLWADNYDRELTDIFAIQTEIARAIVDSLQASLTEREEEQIDTQLTNSVAAYDAFVRARERFNQPDFSVEKYVDIRENVAQAVKLDPEFAAAWALNALALNGLIWANGDPSGELTEQARASVDRAFELRPDLPEARMALGDYHYRIHRDYQSALSEFEAAYAVAPSNAALLVYMGTAQRRLGLFDESVESYKKAVELDPENVDAMRLLTHTLMNVHRLDESISIAEDYLANNDYVSEIDIVRAFAYMHRDLDLSKMREAVARIPDSNSNVLSNDARVVLPWLERDYEGVLEALEIPGVARAYDSAAGIRIGDMFRVKALRALGRQDEAQEIIDRLTSDTSWSEHEPTSTEISSGWGLWLVHSELFWANGQCDKSLELLVRIREYVPLDQDALIGSQVIVYPLHMFAHCGRADQAMDDMENYMGKTWDFQRSRFVLFPEWEVMHGNPRFREIVGLDDR